MRRALTVAGAWLLALAACGGCATPTPGLPLPPSEAERAAFGPVAVVADATAPREPSRFPSGGGGEGAVSGMREAGGTVGKIAESSPFVGGVVGLFVFPIAAVVGAATAPPREEVARATEVIRPIVEDVAVDDAFAARFVADAEAKAGVRCVAVGDASTVVRLEVVRIDLSAQGGQSSYGLSVTGRARVVRAADGHVVHEATLTTVSPTSGLTYFAWADNDGRVLRAAIDGCLSRLASALVEEIFLVDRTLAALRGAKP
jgi:hypothetical protein